MCVKWRRRLDRWRRFTDAGECRMQLVADEPREKTGKTLAELYGGAGLRCPKCGFHGVPVQYGRHDNEEPAKWRKRRCGRCGHPFDTKETII